MTVKALRERDARRLAERLNPAPTPEETEAARHTMRLFYRFAAAYYNAETLYNMRSATQEQKATAGAKADKAYKRAAEALKAYNLIIDIPGLYPIIDETNGANFTLGHWYI